MSQESSFMNRVENFAMSVPDGSESDEGEYTPMNESQKRNLRDLLASKGLTNPARLVSDAARKGWLRFPGQV